MKKISGCAWKFGKNIDTDGIISGRFVNITDPMELAKHCMEDVAPNFVRRVKSGDIIVADSNFGCGSSRESAPLAIKYAGIGAIVAVSFARIFYRNSVNIGLPIFESPEAYEGIDEGDELEIDPLSGLIINLTKHSEFGFLPYSDIVRYIISKGGLIPYAAERLSILESNKEKSASGPNLGGTMDAKE